jgi:hypothetical protein
MACVCNLLDLGCVRPYVLSCVDAESPVYVCWQFWMYANPVGYLLSNQLVMLCVDDELLFLCLLCGFILISQFSVAQFCICLPVDNNS